MHFQKNKDAAKDWFIGPWNSKLDIPVGYANEGVNEKHFHSEMNEIYLVASGSSKAVVGDEEIVLVAGDMLVVEPNEIHTFVSSSPDYFHFVIHTPFKKGDKTLV